MLLILAMLFPSLARGAVVEPEVSERAKAMLAAYSKLVFQQGEIDLRQGLAKLKLTEGFRFLSAKDAKTVLVDFWGNSPDQHPLGMIVPPDTHLLSSGSWAVIINYEDDGHVKDADADSINYSRLLQEMQDGIRKWNATRKQQHFPSIELVGWAIPPHYEKATHKLHWAKELKFEDSEGNTLNYDIRVLGRHGVLSLNTVASMTRLEDVTQRAPAIVDMVEFTPGNRYSDFNPSSDHVAAYGLAALVAGGIAAKTGLLKMLLVGLLAAKKLVIVGVLAAGYAVKKLFARKEG